MSYADTILIFKPRNSKAVQALNCVQNGDRLISYHPQEDPINHDDSRGRESTPYVPPPPEIELHLKLHPFPHDPMQGFVFGSSEESCDILLNFPSKEIHGISRRHFAITFNWKSRIALLRNLSRNGVKIGPLAGGEKLTNEQSHCLVGRITIFIGYLEFEISIPNRGKDQLKYNKRWEDFRSECERAVPAIGKMALHPGPAETPCIVRRQGQRSIYILHDRIGSGAYGEVYKAVDEKTGNVYAAKKLVSKWKHDNDYFVREIAIGEQLHHEHIVSTFDIIRDDLSPILVMDYIPFGSLEDQVEISFQSTKLVLQQALQALVYLHDCKITHRDIKPSNILVYQQTPAISIKLCDFGLATYADILNTFCGTFLFCAPEVALGQYTNAVDIWSLAVVGLKYLRGIPKDLAKEVKYESKEQWQEWHRQIHNIANDMYETESPDNLLKQMLDLDPDKRPTAEHCLIHPWFHSMTTSSLSDQTDHNSSTVSESSWDAPTEVIGEQGMTRFAYPIRSRVSRPREGESKKRDQLPKPRMRQRSKPRHFHTSDVSTTHQRSYTSPSRVKEVPRSQDHTKNLERNLRTDIDENYDISSKSVITANMSTIRQGTRVTRSESRSNTLRRELTARRSYSSSRLELRCARTGLNGLAAKNGHQSGIS